MALGAIVNANNAFCRPTSTRRLKPPLRLPAVLRMVDTEKKTGKLTLTYATQIHACVVEIDRETGVGRDRRLRRRRRLRHADPPADRRGPGARRDRARDRRALFEDFVYDEDGQLLTSNFYDYHVPHALDVPR
jgi:2-furoyl-CoA dehydrogenase large subunit